MNPTNIRITWPAFDPVPASIDLKVYYLGVVLYTIPLPGDRTQQDITVGNSPSSYAATVQAVYAPIPCTLTVL